MLVREGVHIASVYGGTEFGLPIRVLTSAIGRGPQEWMYLEIANQVKPRWVDQKDGSFELQLLSTDAFPLALENLPDVRGYATKDLFVPHPTKKGLWKMFVFCFAHPLADDPLTCPRQYWAT
jgi:hypothetical protein